MRRKLELKEITENATLLNEMLNQLEGEAQMESNSTEEITEDTLATLKVLYESCQKLQPTILILIGDTDDNECLDDALEANDLVTEVFKKYHQLVVKNRSRKTSACLISTPNACGAAATMAQNGNNTKNSMDELNEIFASSSAGINASHSNTKNIMTFTPLEPTPVAAKSKTNGNCVLCFANNCFISKSD